MVPSATLHGIAKTKPVRPDRRDSYSCLWPAGALFVPVGLSRPSGAGSFSCIFFTLTKIHYHEKQYEFYQWPINLHFQVFERTPSNLSFPPGNACASCHHHRYQRQRHGCGFTPQRHFLGGSGRHHCFFRGNDRHADQRGTAYQQKPDHQRRHERRDHHPFRLDAVPHFQYQ